MRLRAAMLRLPTTPLCGSTLLRQTLNLGMLQLGICGFEWKVLLVKCREQCGTRRDDSQCNPHALAVVDISCSCTRVLHVSECHDMLVCLMAECSRSITL